MAFKGWRVRSKWIALLNRHLVAPALEVTHPLLSVQKKLLGHRQEQLRCGHGILTCGAPAAVPAVTPLAWLATSRSFRNRVHAARSDER